MVVVGVALGAQTQFTPWTPAENLGPVVNSAAAEGCAFPAKSELSLFVVSVRGGGLGGQDIYVSQRDSPIEAWGPLQNLGPVINSAANDLCPTLSIDGHHLFFVSERSGGFGKQDLYVARRHNKRDDFGWEPPVNLGVAVNSSENDFTPTLFEDDTTGDSVLFFSSERPGGPGLSDIYSSARVGDYFAPATLVQDLSTSALDQRPNIRRDGLEIFFDSNRIGGVGSTDIWVSTRNSTSDPWSTPVNLGPAVNSAAAETRPALSFDGWTLYFGSARLGGSGSSDIYVTTRARLQGGK
jgi:Tol biopolymer transport system component